LYKYKQKDNYLIFKFIDHNIKQYDLNLYQDNYIENFNNIYDGKIKIKTSEEITKCKGYLTLFYHKNSYNVESFQ
jgi:hypothetical protein